METADRQSFRVVQLSDLHLTAKDDAARSEPKLLGPLRGMNAAFRSIVRSELVKSADIVLVTGDVTDTGAAAEWRLFWREIHAGGLSPRTLVLPGNHDVCELGLRSPLYVRRTAESRKRADAGLSLGQQETRFPWARVVAEGKILIAGIDSCNRGNWSALTNAVGRIGEYQLERLARTLHRHASVPVKLIAMHHSPNIPRADTERRRGLRSTGLLSRLGHEVPREERLALRLLSVSQGVRLIMHGHLHRAEDRRVSGIRIVGAPATTETDRRGRYKLWRYSVDLKTSLIACDLVEIPAARRTTA